MPPSVGQKPSDVKAALAALCTPSPCTTVEYMPQSDPTIPFGQVVRTDPAADQSLAPGDRVIVFVSIGDMSDDGSFYEVSKGELFSIIANKHGFKPWQELKPFNPGIDYDHLEVGDLIWIPASH